MIRFDKFTQKAQEAVQQAQSLAAESSHQQIQTAHLLVTLVEQEEGVVQAVFSKCGMHPDAVAQEAQRLLEAIPKVTGTESGAHVAPSLNEVFQKAQKETARFKDEYVSTEHLLLAMCGMKRDPAGELLNKMGASHEAILQALVRFYLSKPAFRRPTPHSSGIIKPLIEPGNLSFSFPFRYKLI